MGLANPREELPLCNLVPLDGCALRGLRDHLLCPELQDLQRQVGLDAVCHLVDPLHRHPRSRQFARLWGPMISTATVTSTFGFIGRASDCQRTLSRSTFCWACC